MIEIVT